MKVKIFKILLKYFFPILIFFLTGLISKNFPYSQYFIITFFYILLLYYLLVLVRHRRTNLKNYSVNNWLDRLDGGDDLCEELFSAVKKESILENLEYVYNKLNVITKFDKTKLLLLKGYFKTKNNEGPYDLFFKTFLGILVAVTIWGLNKGIIWNLASVINMPSLLNVNSTYIKVLNFIVILFEGLLFYIYLINDYFINKHRNAIIVEIIDVCVENIEDN